MTSTRTELTAYRRGWKAGANPTPEATTRADRRRETAAWYAGFFDREAGRPMYATLTATNA